MFGKTMTAMAESIIGYVKRRLKEVGPREWPSLHAKLGGNPSLPRKLVYDRTNTRVNELEPYYRHFLALDGLSKLPHETAPSRKRGRG